MWHSSLSPSIRLQNQDTSGANGHAESSRCFLLPVFRKYPGTIRIGLISCCRRQRPRRQKPIRSIAFWMRAVSNAISSLAQTVPQPYAFTKHSPEGPFFATFGPPNDYSFSPELPCASQCIFGNSAQSRIAVVGQYLLSDLTEYTRLYVEERFTEEPWECARSHLGQSRYRILFRKR